MRSHAEPFFEAVTSALARSHIGTMHWQRHQGIVAVNNALRTILKLSLGGDSLTEEAFYARVFHEDRERVRTSFESYLEKPTKEPVEIHMRVINGLGSLKKLNCVMSYVETPDDSAPEMILIIQDFTKAEEERTETLLKSDLERLIMSISIKLIGAPLEHIDAVINDALADISRYVGADRAYLFTYDWKQGTCQNTHEWCAEGIEPQIEALQEISVKELDIWTNSHQKQLPFIATAVMSLDPEHPLRMILEPQGVQSLATIPVCVGDECIGFIGFDSVRTTHHYNDVEISLLELLADLIANTQTKRDREQRLLDTMASLEDSRNSALMMAGIARSANEARSSFVAAMSHEIRTPLHVILGTVELLQDSGPDDIQRGHLKTLETSGHKLLELIGDVLEVSQLESGNLMLEPLEFSLQSLVDTLDFVLRPIAARKCLSLTFAIAPGSPDRLVHDIRCLRQIIQNVAGNAIKFTEQGSVNIDLAVDRQFSSSSENTWSLSVTVTDTGMGISDDDLKHLHEPFFQGTRDPAKATSGTGLGLAITYNLVTLMNGSFSVNSKVGEGAVFRIRIPTHVPAHSTMLAIPPTAQDHAPEITFEQADALLTKARILVAEDNEMCRRMIQTHLSKFACLITFVESGKAAVAAVECEDFDLILMDCQMPVMDGFRATRAIRVNLAQQARRQPAIIAVTANSVQGDREKCLAAGMNFMLNKPFSKNQLAATLVTWLTLGEEPARFHP